MMVDDGSSSSNGREETGLRAISGVMWTEWWVDTGSEEVEDDQVGLWFPVLEVELVWGGRQCIRALFLEQHGTTWCKKNGVSERTQQAYVSLWTGDGCRDTLKKPAFVEGRVPPNLYSRRKKCQKMTDTELWNASNSQVLSSVGKSASSSALGRWSQYMINLWGYR